MCVARAAEQFVRRADAVDADVGEPADVERGGAGQMIDVDGGVRLLADVLQQPVFKDERGADVVETGDGVVFACAYARSSTRSFVFLLSQVSQRMGLKILHHPKNDVSFY